MPNVSNAQPIHKTDITDGRSENNRDSNLASNIPNGIEVERRLKKELLDLGFLDMNDFPKVCTLQAICVCRMLQSLI